MGRREPESGGEGKGGGPSFGEELRRWRTIRGLTLQQLAAAAGCGKAYLSMIETGGKANPPSDELVAKLEWGLRVPRGELMRLAQWHGTPAAVRRQIESLEARQRAAVVKLKELVERGVPRSADEGAAGVKTPSRVLDELWRSGKLKELIEELGGGDEDRARGSTDLAEPRSVAREIPLINSVAAGYPRDFTDLGYPARVADSYVRSPDIVDPDAFACRVVGDSMTPEYREGDIVVFSPARPVVSGADCFVRLEPDHETTFKRVVLLDAKGAEVKVVEGVARERAHARVTHMRLVALNEKYPPRVVGREEVSGLWVAVSVTRRVGGGG